jgi:hypothetical protein
MIQPAVLGGLFWFSIWCVVLGYILELYKEPIKDQKPQTLTRQKILNNATKLIIAISALLPMPIFAMIFELWVETHGNTEQSLDLLRTVSSIAFSGAISWITTYITYQQYQANRKLSQ